VKRPGRPRTSKLTRAEQRAAPARAARPRPRAGRCSFSSSCPRPSRQLAAAARIPGYPQALDALLDDMVVRLADYPALADLAWNRADEYLPARKRFGLYERNWRFGRDWQLGRSGKRALIERLAQTLRRPA